jgi:hypothetical protein
VHFCPATSPDTKVKVYIERVPVSVGRVRRDECRQPGSDARSRPALGCGCLGLSLAPCVGLGFLVRLRFASRSPAMWRVCAIALSFVSGWRAFSSVSLCKSILNGRAGWRAWPLEGRLHLGGASGAWRCPLPGRRVPVRVGRVRRDACRWPGSDARSRPALG